MTCPSHLLSKSEAGVGRWQRDPKVRFLPGPEAPRVLAFGRREEAPEVCRGLTQLWPHPRAQVRRASLEGWHCGEKVLETRGKVRGQGGAGGGGRGFQRWEETWALLVC